MCSCRIYCVTLDLTFSVEKLDSKQKAAAPVPTTAAVKYSAAPFIYRSLESDCITFISLVQLSSTI